MDGTAPHQNAPPAPPAAPAQNIIVTGGIPAAVEAGGNLLTKVSGFTPQQAQTAAVLVLTLFMCGILGYQMWSGQRSQAETLSLVIRSMESESEKNRAANAIEFERNRLAFERESKLSRDAISDTGKLMLTSHQKLAQEMGRFESTMGRIDGTMGELKVAITALRQKLPPQEDGEICPLPRPVGSGDVRGLVVPKGE